MLPIQIHVLVSSHMHKKLLFYVLNSYSVEVLLVGVRLAQLAVH